LAQEQNSGTYLAIIHTIPPILIISMRTSSSPSATKSKITIRQVFFWALLFIFGSQFAFHFLIGASLRSDEECSAQSAPGSPRCTEVILFQKWQADALAAADPDPDTLEELLLERTELTEGEVETAAVETITSLPEDDALSNLIAALAVNRPDLAAWVSTSSPPESLDTSHPEITEVSEVATSELADESQADGQEQGMSDWGQNLVALQERLEARMHSLRSFRNIEDSQVDASKAMEMKATHMTAWARDLEAFQHQMEKRAADMAEAKVARHKLLEEHAVERKDRAEKRRLALHATEDSNITQHQAKGVVATAENVGTQVETGKPLMQRIFDLGRELCSEPERRDRPSCIQFLTSGKNESGSAKSAEDASYVESEETQNAKVEPLMASDQPMVSRYELTHSLNWPAVRNWKESSSKLRGYFPVGVVTTGRDQLRHAKWAGMIPKVACVSVVPPGRTAKYQIKYLVNNFRLQTYEGPRQLVLVYDHNDRAAKQLVEKFSDGYFIRGAAARSDGEFPSTMAYRFGAYVADADIIARWDFDAWHHPDRLAMQVRALAHKARPVTRLSAWTLRNGTEDSRSEPGASIGEASLVGEKAWMAEHWHPFLGDETSTLTSAHLRYLVQLDMPGLLVYSSTSNETQ